MYFIAISNNFLCVVEENGSRGSYSTTHMLPVFHDEYVTIHQFGPASAQGLKATCHTGIAGANFNSCNKICFSYRRNPLLLSQLFLLAGLYFTPLSSSILPMSKNRIELLKHTKVKHTLHCVCLCMCDEDVTTYKAILYELQSIVTIFRNFFACALVSFHIGMSISS